MKNRKIYTTTRKVLLTPSINKSLIVEADAAIANSLAEFKNNQEQQKLEDEEIAKIATEIEEMMTKEDINKIYDYMKLLGVSVERLAEQNEADNRMIEAILSFDDPDQLPRESRRINFALVEESMLIRETEEVQATSKVKPTGLLIGMKETRTVEVRHTAVKKQKINGQGKKCLPSTSVFDEIPKDFVISPSKDLPELIFDE